MKKEAMKKSLIVLNVSGIKYQLEKEVLHKFPGALLDAILTTHGSHENNNSHEINSEHDGSDNEHLEDFQWISDKNKTNDYVFVQRSPQMFEHIVLQTYVTGKLHVPKWMCAQSVMDELKFWRLKIENACSCCSEEDSQSAENEQEGQSSLANHIGVSKWESVRAKVWDVVDKPTTSVLATIFSVVSLFFVFLSCAVFVAGSFKMSQLCVNDTNVVVITNENVNFTDIFKPVASEKNFTLSLSKNEIQTSTDLLTDSANGGISDSAEDTPVFFSNCQATQTLQILEMVCIIWFTFELGIRLIFCPSVTKFFKHPLNIIDILATLPYYIELALAYWEYNSPQVKRLHGIFVLVRVLRCLRVFRILKLARYFQELRILGKTLKAAKDELCMLAMFVFIAVFIFSSVMYQLEKDDGETQFTSIPASCWWGIVTLTTVGYGDMFPKTIPGKVLAAIACVAGIIITAFPVSILVEHFTDAYKHKSKIFKIRHPQPSDKVIQKSVSVNCAKEAAPVKIIDEKRGVSV